MASSTIPAHPLDEKEPPKAPQLMFACIERAGGISLCNRIIKEREFAFSKSAVKHVVDFYDPRTMKRSASLRLTGCIACIDNAKEILAKEGLSRLA